MPARRRYFMPPRASTLPGRSSANTIVRIQLRALQPRGRRQSSRASKIRLAGKALLIRVDTSLEKPMQTGLDSEAIKKLLPHRYPFLLVDRIIELTPLERIVGIKQVSINESFFQGHFPGAPVMPGVLVIEALAQCGAILALREIPDRDQKLVLFTGIREARFRRPVVPGDTLTLEVTALRIGSRVQSMRGEAKVDGQLAADAEIMSIVVNRELEKVEKDEG